eukprot:195746-Pleurochrysis_carterae.AAC.1
MVKVDIYAAVAASAQETVHIAAFSGICLLAKVNFTQADSVVAVACTPPRLAGAKGGASGASWNHQCTQNTLCTVQKSLLSGFSLSSASQLERQQDATHLRAIAPSGPDAEQKTCLQSEPLPFETTTAVSSAWPGRAATVADPPRLIATSLERREIVRDVRRPHQYSGHRV